MAHGHGVGELRPFYIVSEAKEKCVLDIKRANAKPGTSVTIHPRKKEAAPNQLWYVGPDGFIRSKLNDMALSVTGSDKELVTAIYSGDPRHQWKIDGKKIVNQMFCNECLSVQKKLVRVPDDAEVCSSEYEGNPLQHWKIDFVG